jgi:sulfate permease, SulP family
MKKYFNLFDFSQRVDYKTEVLSGLTVAMALIPEAVAFAFIAGLFSLTDLSAACMMVIITLFTRVLHNLDSVVLIGLILATLFFTYGNAKKIRARKHIDEDGVKFYLIPRPLFFASITAFNEKFDVLNEPAHVIINFAESRVVDMSDIEALNKIKERYHKVGKKAQLTHLSPDCCRLIKNPNDIIDVKIMVNPTYKLVVDELP